MPLALAMLTRLLSLADCRPVALSFLGAISGAATLVITWGEYLNLAFKLAGGFFGALCTFSAFLLALPKVIRFLRAWRARGLEHADRE